MFWLQFTIRSFFHGVVKSCYATVLTSFHEGGLLLLSEALGKEGKEILCIPHFLADVVKEAHHLDPHIRVSHPLPPALLALPLLVFVVLLHAKMACDILAWGVNRGRQDLKNIHE